MKELLRRLYVEVVRGRTRVRVVDSSEVSAKGAARFLLSPYRSGTTLLRYCLDSHPELAVPPETDFFAPLLRVLDDEQSMAGFSDLGYAREDVSRSLGAYYRKFLDVYASGKNSSYWLDKSPRYAENPDVLKEALPDAKFVVMHRHPLDQIHSITRGGTEVFHAMTRLVDPDLSGRALLVESARYWSRVTRGLNTFQEKYPESVITVRYEDLCRRPERTLGSILEHLHLPWSDNVLEFHRFDHDQGRESTRVAGTRGFSLSSGAWQQWEADWSDEVWSIVEDAARPLGYELAPERE